MLCWRLHRRIQVRLFYITHLRGVQQEALALAVLRVLVRPDGRLRHCCAIQRATAAAAAAVCLQSAGDAAAAAVSLCAAVAAAAAAVAAFAAAIAAAGVAAIYSVIAWGLRVM